MVTRVGLGKERELAVAPVELARVDDDTTDVGAVATDPLGRGVEDKVGTVLDGLDDGTAVAESVVDNQRDAGGVGNVGNGAVVGHVVLGVTEGLDVDSLGVFVDGGLDVLGLVAGDKLDLDAETGQRNLEQVVGAAVKVAGSNNVVTGLGNAGNGAKLGSLARRGRHGHDTALEGGHPLLKDIRRGVHETGVDVAELSTRNRGIVWMK